MPDINAFNRYDNRDNFFASFDYMGVLPTLNSCNGYMAFCDKCRIMNIRLDKNQLKSEERAYLAIKNNEYVTTNYGWQR